MTEHTYTSLVGYREHVLSGMAGAQRRAILSCLFESAVPLTRFQISKLTGIRLSSVCGRVNTLLRSGLVEVSHEAVDLSTGRLAEHLMPLWPQPGQREFEWLKSSPSGA